MSKYSVGQTLRVVNTNSIYNGRHVTVINIRVNKSGLDVYRCEIISEQGRIGSFAETSLEDIRVTKQNIGIPLKAHVGTTKMPQVETPFKFSIGDRVRALDIELLGGFQNKTGTVTASGRNIRGMTYSEIRWDHRPDGRTTRIYDVHLNAIDPLAKPAPAIEMPNFTTLNEALLFDYQSRQPKYTGLADERIKAGLCPHCGEKGRYHMSTAVCSKHGVY